MGKLDGWHKAVGGAGDALSFAMKPATGGELERQRDVFGNGQRRQ